MATRNNYLITATTFEELVSALNIYMEDIANRLDKAEGIRGNPNIQSGVTVKGSVTVNDDDEVKIHSME